MKSVPSSGITAEKRRKGSRLRKCPARLGCGAWGGVVVERHGEARRRVAVEVRRDQTLAVARNLVEADHPQAVPPDY